MARLADSPAGTAVLLGAGGLATLGGLVAAPSPALAQEPVDNARETARYKNVVFVGMNPGGSYEVSHMRKWLGHNGVKFIKPAKQQDTIVHQGVKYDLSQPEGRQGFVAALGLTADRAEALEKLLHDIGDKGRDELAQLARVFDQAERGDRYIERLVFSGESVGSSVWGHDNGTLSWRNVGKLAMIFPKAAGQVEDLLLSACYSGGESTMDTYRGIFPNVKTIWAYDGSAPGAASGAVPHMLRWNRGTVGTSTDNLDRDAARHTRKGENVAVWTVSNGYDNGETPGDISVDRAAYDSTASVVSSFLSGDEEITSPQTGPLRDHYNNIQRMLGRGDVPAAERTALEGERDQVIRMLYYKNISGYFQTIHGSTIDAGFSELGLNTPDFSQLSRADAMAAIDAYNAAYDASDAPSPTTSHLHELLNEGLKDLSSDHVPETWI